MRKFINLSNHPSVKWSEPQLKAAQALGTIIDIAFPAIPPHANHCDVAQLVDEYVNKIVDSCVDDDFVVHVMGELTFNFAFVTEMKAKGIKCLASTTQRIVKEIGTDKKEVLFNFMSFREY